jgi:ATPase subunit of ABC transporter with duplicated ATPase domains
LATRIIDVKGKRLINFQGTFDEYLASQAEAEARG